jgi:signal transduction histidine kinase
MPALKGSENRRNDMNIDNTCKNDLEFFGKITASVSHELNNVLSIINEYSGLLSDLLSACQKYETVDFEKVLSITKNIAEQVKREKDIINLLNRFSHNVDSPLAEFILNDMINDIIKLTKRFASLKRVELQLFLCPEEIRIISNPFKIQHTVFLILSLALELGNSIASIDIAVEKHNGEVNILITVPSFPIDTDETELEIINGILNSINGKLEKAKIDNQFIFKIILPLSIQRD